MVASVNPKPLITIRKIQTEEWPTSLLSFRWKTLIYVNNLLNQILCYKRRRPKVNNLTTELTAARRKGIAVLGYVDDAITAIANADSTIKDAAAQINIAIDTIQAITDQEAADFD